MRAIREAVESLRGFDPRVVVVTSRSDRAFSVGADLKERAGMTADDLISCRPIFVAAHRSLLNVGVPFLQPSTALRWEEVSNWP